MKPNNCGLKGKDLDDLKQYKERFSLLAESHNYLKKHGKEILDEVNEYFRNLPKLFNDFKECAGEQELRGLRIFMNALKDYPTIYFAFLHALSYDLAVHFNLVKNKKKNLNDISGFEIGCIALISAIRQVHRDINMITKTLEPLLPI